MKLLALDTATENCSAALLIDATLHTREVERERGHAELILPMVDELLTAAGITLKDLDAIAFGRGPGSFTGVRLGITVTQGLAFGAGLGVVPISDLQAVAQRVLDTAAPPVTSTGIPSGAPPPVTSTGIPSGTPPLGTSTSIPSSTSTGTSPGGTATATPTRILVCNDARMSEVYWACFERGPDGLAHLKGEERVSKPTEVKLPPDWVTATAAGRGFLAYGEALRLAVPSVPFALNTQVPPDPIHYLPRATEIARLAVPAVRAGRLLNADEALPVYLRDNVAQPSAKPHGQPS